MGGESWLHRLEPVVRKVRRRKPPGLFALRSRSNSGCRVGAGPRDGTPVARRAEDAVLSQDVRLERNACIHSNRARTFAEGGLDVRQSLLEGNGGEASGS